MGSYLGIRDIWSLGIGLTMAANYKKYLAEKVLNEQDIVSIYNNSHLHTLISFARSPIVH